MSSNETAWTVAIERHELVSQRPFDAVVADIHSGLGHPNFPALLQQLSQVPDWDAFTAVVQESAGSSGLMVFLELDLGSVLARDPKAVERKAIRIIAGNPVTMAAMTRTTPAAGAYAPITILVFEADDGVHCRYDTIVSATGDELTEDAAGTARQLDESVLGLLAGATDC